APPAEKTSARSDQAGKASTGDGAGDGRDCCPVRQRPNRTHVRINLVNIAKGPQGVTVLTWYSCPPLYVSCRLVERSPTKEDIVESNRERLGLRWIRRRRRRQGRYGKRLVEPGAIKKIPHARDCDVAREKVVESSRRVDGLLRDKTRKPGTPPLPAATVQKVVDLVTGPPPGETTHWTGRMLAKAVGISLRSVQRILEAHHLAPHRIRTFKLSNDPKFADKLRDVVGLYVDPPAHAAALSVDEKSQIQALDHTQPGLPMKPGRAGTMTHDYKRNGTTTLFAALNVLDGTIIGRNMKRHRHQEFIRFLNE